MRVREIKSAQLDLRLPLAETWKRQKKLEEVSFIFPNAPDIPITIVRTPFRALQRVFDVLAY